MLSFNTRLAAPYSNVSQQVRVMSEAWVAENLVCPFCKRAFSIYSNGQPGYDFFCSTCHENFQLKSFKRKLRKSIPGGEYRKTIEKFQKGMQPNLLLLAYEPRDWSVLQVFFVKKEHVSLHFITPRNPLKTTARRAGWQGCNWRIGEIPESDRERLLYVEPESRSFKIPTISNGGESHTDSV